MVMARFREHGLLGNPVIRLKPDQVDAFSSLAADTQPRLAANPIVPLVEP